MLNSHIIQGGINFKKISGIYFSVVLFHIPTSYTIDTDTPNLFGSHLHPRRLFLSALFLCCHDSKIVSLFSVNIPRDYLDICIVLPAHSKNSPSAVINATFKNMNILA